MFEQEENGSEIESEKKNIFRKNEWLIFCELANGSFYCFWCELLSEYKK